MDSAITMEGQKAHFCMPALDYVDFKDRQYNV